MKNKSKPATPDAPKAEAAQAKPSVNVGDTVAFVIPSHHHRAGQAVPATVTHVTGEGVISVSPSIAIHHNAIAAARMCSGIQFAEPAAEDGKHEPGTWHELAVEAPAAETPAS